METAAIKLFDNSKKGDLEFEHEAEYLELLSESPFTIKHLESAARGQAPGVPMTCTIKRSLPAEMWFGNYSYLMFPMLPNDTLLALLMRANHNNGFRPRRKLSITLQKYLCRQLVEALIYLHQVDKMAHGDVKPDNTMITHDYRLVLIDFGHSEKVKKLIKHRIGTPAYRGPEVPDATCDESEYYAVERAELYALGCTLFTIMFQNIPFKNVGEEDKRFTAQAFHDAY